jgi:hypothetical protein
MMKLLKRLTGRLFGNRLKFQPLRAYSAYHTGQDEEQNFTVSVHMRVTNKSARTCSLVGLQIRGQRGTVWEQISEVVCPPVNMPRALPLDIPGKTTIDFWIHAYLPQAFRQSLYVGKLQLKVKAHSGKQYKQWFTAGPCDLLTLAHI